MNRNAPLTRALFPLLLAAVMLAVCFAAILPSHAAALTVADPSIDKGAFTLVISFPAEDWRGGFDFQVTYDASVYEAGTATCSAALANSLFNSPSAGKLNLVGAPNQSAAPTATTISIPFTVKDSSKTDSKITVTVNALLNFDGEDLIAEGTVYTADPKEPVAPPPPTSDTSTATSTTDTSTDTSSDTSTVTSTKDTDTNTSTSSTTDKPTTSTSTDTTTDKTTPTSSVKPPVTDSGTVTDSATVTDTASVSDTADLSDGGSVDASVETATDIPGIDTVTDSGVGTVPSELLTIIIGPGSTSTADTQAEDGVSSGTVAVIAIAVAALLCCGLTLLGFLRYKRED